MRPAGYGGHVQVPAIVNLGGAHLCFMAESARHRGSALALVATEHRDPELDGWEAHARFLQHLGSVRVAA
jgi:hypothetical protein